MRHALHGILLARPKGARRQLNASHEVLWPLVSRKRVDSGQLQEGLTAETDRRIERNWGWGGGGWGRGRGSQNATGG